MNTKAINRSEWNNAKNWSRLGLFGIYFSKNDSRAIVPKATPVLGWTLNFGHRYSVLSLVTITVLPLAIVIVALILRNHV